MANPFGTPIQEALLIDIDELRLTEPRLVIGGESDTWSSPEGGPPYLLHFDPFEQLTLLKRWADDGDRLTAERERNTWPRRTRGYGRRTGTTAPGIPLGAFRGRLSCVPAPRARRG